MREVGESVGDPGKPTGGGVWPEARANNTDWKAVESRRDNTTVVEWVVEALRRPQRKHWSCATGTHGIVGLETEQKERWVGIPHSLRTQHVFLPTGRNGRLRRKGHVDIQQTFFGC